MLCFGIMGKAMDRRKIRHSLLSAALAQLLLATTCVALRRSAEPSAALGEVPASSLSAPPRKYAIVTLVADSSWVPGVRTLGCSLREFARQNHVDMLAMCYEVAGNKSQIEEAGWTCLSPEVIPNPQRNRWKWDYTQKIAPFRLTQYERVVVMDSDMVVVNPGRLGSLFQMPFPEGNIMAVPDCATHLMRKFTREEASIMIQGGLMVLRPSEDAFQMLQAAVRKIRSLDGGGQGFMSQVLAGKVTWLPATFNYVRASKCVNLIDRQSGYYSFDDDAAVHAARNTARHRDIQAQAAADVAAGNVTVAHFHFMPKPWNCDPQNVAACGKYWITGTSRIDVLYEAWLNVYHSCQGSSADPASAGGSA